MVLLVLLVPALVVRVALVALVELLALVVLDENTPGATLIFWTFYTFHYVSLVVNDFVCASYCF